VAVDHRRIEVVALSQGLDAESLDASAGQLVENRRHHLRPDIRRNGVQRFVGLLRRRQLWLLSG
jgi:hypothetical protein